MSDISKQITDLSPEKRKLLELLLKDEGVNLARSVIVPQKRDTDSFPLSFAQQRLWFIDQLEPGSGQYNIPVGFRMVGSLDIRVLEEVIHRIVQRHESLRTVFSSRDDEPIQVVTSELKLKPRFVDLRTTPVSRREEEARQMLIEDAQQPFVLERGPLMRVTVLRLQDKEYWVLLTLHHIISDGWSMSVLAKEITSLYQTTVSGAPSPLPDLSIQYSDFACWQREWFRGEEVEKQVRYWREQLGGAVQVLDLPSDRPRPAVASYRGESYEFDIPGDLSRSLERLAREEDATMFMALLSGFHALLYRYSGQEDISVGTPIANRNRAEIEDLVGFFVNTLVMRVLFSRDLTFRQLLRKVREVTLGAHAHQDLPFEKLVEELDPERATSHAPLFQVMFVYQNLPQQSFRLPGMTIEPLRVDQGTTPFDITFSIFEQTGGLKGSIDYSADLFDHSTMERLAEHSLTLLRAAVADPDQPVSAATLLTPAEQRTVVVDWNDTAISFRDRDATLHGLFEATAHRDGSSIALEVEGEQLSYSELNQRANKLAHYLVRHGVGPEVRVGVCLERSIEMIVAMLGILKAGGAYVALDPAYPNERVQYILLDSRATLLLTQKDLVGGLPEDHPPAVLLDSEWDGIASEKNSDPGVHVLPENLAYVIYTSGSTGRPKGVAIEHRSAVNLVQWASRVFPSEVTENTLASTSICFDLSVFEIFVPLSSGGSVTLVRNALDVLQFGEDSRVTLVNTVPSAIAELVRERGIPDSVRVVNLAGELLPTSLVKKIYDLPGERKVYDLYGPSETTTYSTYAFREPDRRPIVGRPVANTQIYILDQSQQPVPVGVPGELYIGGSGLARGYLEKPDLTAERFVPEPFSGKSGSLMYRTGDLARYLADGNIEYLGRVDHQVKVRGFRIELGEIESELRQYGSVKEAVVIVREDTPGDKRLVAYCVPNQIPGPQPSHLRGILKEKLPDYMVPSAFVEMDEIPLTPNGKVDRRALPIPELGVTAAKESAPRTPVEEILVEIWSEVLSVDHVGVEDSFFDLGGHSLLATRLMSRLRRAFEIEVPLRTLFENPTVAGLATAIEAKSGVRSEVDVPPLEPVRRDGKLPLSFAQQRLWFLSELEEGGGLYNIPAAFRLVGALDVEVLERSINEVIRRHESLRTSFATVEGEPVAVIDQNVWLELPVMDLRDVPPTEQNSRVYEIASARARQPFVLANGPLVRGVLLRLADEEHIGVFTMHHIISDGWSIGVLIGELGALYKAYIAGEESPLPDLSIQYPDYAVWQRSWLQGEVLEGQLAYWKDMLQGVPPLLELPTDRPRPAMQTIRGGRKNFTLPAEQSEALASLSRNEGVTLYMTLLAGLQILLHRHSGQQDISVGTPIANRNRSETEGLIGFFVNTLVMRSDLSGVPSVREVLHRVRDIALGAYAHQDVPFEKVVDAIQPERDISHSPLFQVMFTLQNAPEEAVDLPGLRIEPVEVDTGVSRFDLTMTMVEESEGLRGSIEYNADLFDAGTIDRMVSHFQNILEVMTTSPDHSIGTIGMLAPSERRHIVLDWNDTTVSLPTHDCTVQSLFEAAVERDGESFALEFMDEQLTYAGLNRRANKFAHHLVRRGVGPETRVGVCLDRSLEMIVAVLGVLKAGGAYVPLDPLYPKDRLQHMVSDSGISLLLTQEVLSDLLPDNRPAMVCVDRDWSRIEAEDDSNPTVALHPENLAYIIYTSGSTGVPKGTLLHHGGAYNLARSWAADFGIGPESKVLQFFSLGFDGSVGEIFSTFAGGGTLCLVPQETVVSMPDLQTLLVEQSVTHVVMTPSVLSVLPAEDLTSLHTVMSGAEICSKELADRWAGGRRFFNLYGPTETTVVVCWHEHLDGSAGVNTVPIGGPIANTKAYIFDPQLNPVPLGVLGELYIGGIGVARGYLNRPDLTAERFLPVPLEEGNGGRMYRTGDVARWLPDGSIEVLGRMDHQVKIRGFRIELGEIEQKLRECPAVGESVVIAKEDAPGAKRLVAYVVPREMPGPGTSELRDFLKTRLPDYMIPSVFVIIEALPLTATGKVDRRALPTPEAVRPDLAGGYVAPSTPAEHTLAAVWQKVLGLEQVGVEDNFFELGGDSILSIKVIAKAREAGLEIAPKQMFQYPTVAGLASVARPAPEMKAEQGIVTGPVPLTPIQHWFFDQSFPN
ncbi:MAG: amino acid adenylation domain-containing protein, partial [Bacteroidota bacterium]